MLRRKAFASLQHGFLRSVENVYIYNFVTPNGVWENVFLYNIDTYFLLSLLGRCYALLYKFATMGLIGNLMVAPSCCSKYLHWKMK